jgi:NAD(P)-dependent dehydrogenase (short-subunit alcohol dehydrogenase family)
MMVLSRCSDLGLTIWKARSTSDATPMGIVNSDPAGDGVTVNSICPGPVVPNLPPVAREVAQAQAQRTGRSDPCKSENARSAVLLASDQSACYVGVITSPDGGDVVL